MQGQVDGMCGACTDSGALRPGWVLLTTQEHQRGDCTCPKQLFSGNGWNILGMPPSSWPKLSSEGSPGDPNLCSAVLTSCRGIQQQQSLLLCCTAMMMDARFT